MLCALSLLSLLSLLFFLLVRRGTLQCLKHGHHWHEGEDTYVPQIQNGAFRWGTFIWCCRRCGKTLPVGSRPPADATWDPAWCSPEDNADCAATYRRRRKP